MLWYPYTQMSKIKSVPNLQSAKGAEMFMTDGAVLVDGISSWWSAIHGYNHEAINNAIKGQLEHFSHIMLGGISHQPALNLASELVRITPQGLNHVFFSDSGSVGVEIALKIALQYHKNKGVAHKTRIAYLKNGYHGDTFKAMEVSSDSDFNTAFSEVLTPQFELNIPTGGYHATPQEVQIAVDEMEQLFKQHHHQIACFILEPIVQCAGGFHIYAPEYLAAAKTLTQQYNILLIADEVATGFGRTGKMFACQHASITPDIMVLGKALTAGYVGHAATLATTEVYNAFLGESYETALMHGPTFMGNALACTIALQGIALFEQNHYLDKIDQIHQHITAELQHLRSKHIVEVRKIGALVALEFSSTKDLEGFAQFAYQKGAWLRPIGNILYLMPAYIISQAQIAQLFNVITLWIEQLDTRGE